MNKILIAVVLAVALCGLWHVRLLGEVNYQQLRNDTLRAAIAEIEPDVKDVVGILDENHALLSRAQMWAYTRERVADPLIFMRELARLTPDGVTLDETRWDQDRWDQDEGLQIVADAESAADADAFVRALKNTASFQDVRVVARDGGRLTVAGVLAHSNEQ